MSVQARLTFNEVVLLCTFDFNEEVPLIREYAEREEVIKAYSNWECLFVLTQYNYAHMNDLTKLLCLISS